MRLNKQEHTNGAEAEEEIEKEEHTKKRVTS